jgi:uncharacterized protein YndB with AHSA1/START domain
MTNNMTTINVPDVFEFRANNHREIIIMRTFKASRHLIFSGLSQPTLISQWLGGPPGWSMSICEVDFKVDGHYRHVWKNAEGQVAAVNGVYHDIAQSERIVRSELFDPPWYPGGSIVTTLLSEKNTHTLLTTTIVYESNEAREVVLKSDMEAGMMMSYDRLATLCNPDH